MLLSYMLIYYYCKQPKIKIVVLKMYMHCEGCVSDVKRKIEEMEGRYSCSLKFDICTETFCT